MLAPIPQQKPPFDTVRLHLIEEYRKTNYEEKAAQKMDANSPNQMTDQSSDKASEDTSSTDSSPDTELMDIRESDGYIESFDKKRRRLIEE